MAPETAETGDEIYQLSDGEADKFFDEAAREYPGMSGDELIEKYESGYWLEPDAKSSAMYLAMVRLFGT